MILVTGGTGLLGSHLLMKLVENGESVRAIYRTVQKRDSVVRVFNYYHPNADELWQKVEWVKGDVLDVSSLEDALDGVAQVYHCAAAVTFIPKEEPYMHNVNVNGTANLVNACLKMEGVRFCHVSSVAAIGRDGSEELISEKNEWKESSHNAAYAISKHNAEMEIWRGAVEGLEAFMINPSLILGPGDWNASTGAMFKKAHKGLPFYTRGGNCFVDVLDVVDSMIHLMASEITNERFIVGAENRKFKEVFGKMAGKMGKKPPRLEASPWMTELTWRFEKIRSIIIGTKPFITKEVAHHALQLNRYDNSKLLAAVPEFVYRDIDETLGFVCKQFLSDQNGSR
jgi:nucleoside-diphosphate-sugar epimerase